MGTRVALTSMARDSIPTLDLREYTHGDDTRHVDWKVEARTDRLFVKQYEQETNYVANILLDGSEFLV